MNVRGLIEYLETLPQDAEVNVLEENNDYGEDFMDAVIGLNIYNAVTGVFFGKALSYGDEQ